jgi:UDP-N-acetylmuramoyl-tripeptide--D-alanyl-D-alanine ligase
MYVPGDIGLLASIAQPRIGIVTNVAPIHLERVGSIERIAHAKSELVAALPPDGLAILNGDNPWTRAMATVSGISRSLLVGLAEDCEYRAVDVRGHGLDGVSFVLRAEGQETPIRTRVPGVHTVHAFLAAAAVARALGMSWDELRAAAEMVNLDARQRILRGADGMLIIDDSYNAAPMSVSAALELLRESPGTRIAVLGDMLELGPEEEASHREVGERAALVADWLVARGERSVWIADEAERRGMPPERVRRVPDNEAAVAAVREILAGWANGTATGEWSVLVKGSRGMRMEEVVNGLRGEA